MDGKGSGIPAKEACWRDRLHRQADSGLTIVEWCRRNNVSRSLFHFWKREIARREAAGREGPPPQPEAPAGLEDSAVAAAAPFARVVLAPGQESPAPACAAASEPNAVARADGTIEIVLANARVVRVAPGFDGPTLGRVLALLEGRPC